MKISPEQNEYVRINKLEKKEIYLLKKFRYINFIFTIVACILLSAYYNSFFMFVMPIAVIIEIMTTSSSLIIIDGDNIHEVNVFRGKIYKRSDYKDFLRYLFNKRNKTMYFTYSISKEQLYKIVKK